MEKTNVIVGGSNISGNLGSCGIKSNSFQKDLWHAQTVAVNSCSGEIVSSSVYWDSTWILFFLIAGLIVSWIIKILRN